MIALALLLATATAASPGVPTPVEQPQALAPWFSALQRTEAGEGVARALHYGDSTIAADGISRTVRDRLAARFGSAGPGFLTASFAEQWHRRSDLRHSHSGSWSVRTILLGGGGDRYGLGGIVGIGRPGFRVKLEALDPAGEVVPLRRAEAWLQGGEGYGSLALSVDGGAPSTLSARREGTEDLVLPVVSEEPFHTIELSVAEGPVPIYGVVLETGGPGTTWEQLGVVGVGSRSFAVHAGPALAEQVRARSPDLVVVMLGGNESGYPILRADGGAGYAPIFRSGLDTILAGRGEAACLVVTPLDQGFLEEQEDGTSLPRSRPGMPNLVAQQRAVAKDAGCAFWSTYDAMGGEGSALTWGRLRGIGAGDYAHVTPKAQAILGDLLSDALLEAYEAWTGGLPAQAP